MNIIDRIKSGRGLPPLRTATHDYPPLPPKPKLPPRPNLKVGTNPPTKSPSPGPPGGKRLSVDVSLINTKEFELLVSILKRMITDERIDKQVRQEHLEEFISNVGD